MAGARAGGSRVRQVPAEAVDSLVTIRQTRSVGLDNGPEDGCREHVDSHRRVEGDAPSFTGDLAVIRPGRVSDGDGVQKLTAVGGGRPR